MVWAPDYVELADFAEFLRITDDVDDTLLPVAITSAARAIDQATNRQFGVVAAAEERLYTAFPDYDRGRWVIVVDDLQTTDDLVILVDGDELTDYRMDPPNAVAKGKAWTRIVVGKDSAVVPTGEEFEVAAMGLWGWSTGIPVPVSGANYLQASRWINRRDSPFGVAGSPDQGSELRLLAKLDADVIVSLANYRRPREVG
jgi:Phage gp6-like head-tail connector protein